MPALDQDRAHDEHSRWSLSHRLPMRADPTLQTTAVFGDMKYIADHFKPDLIMIPIGGHFVMSPEDAAYATREILKPKHAIPMHYGTNPFLVGTPEEYIKVMGIPPPGSTA